MRKLLMALTVLVLAATGGLAVDEDLVKMAEDALANSVTYLRTEVAYGGGYLGSYLEDLSDQWGETHATRTQNWIQPPGCPSVGFSFLRAWEATGEAQYLEAATEVAHALVVGQLECGGWDYIVDHDPKGAEVWFYRRNRDSDDPMLKAGRNVGTFDDNVTQHATRLLMAVDGALEARDPAVHDAATAALEFILAAQLSHGGWPQRFPLSGRYYADFATFNDNSIADCVDVLMTAYRQYGDELYRDAVRKCGEFIIAAQLPEPQATWAQQYDADLKPAWARKFEPAAACAGESVGVMNILLRIAVFLEDGRYLEPIPKALDWYARSVLPDGRYARFYELGTNRPLYLTRDTYFLTYDDSDMPTHYAFQGTWSPRSVEQRYDELRKLGWAEYARSQEPLPLSEAERLARAEGMEARVREVLQAQDERGRWVTKGRLEMQVCERNMEQLAGYLRLVKGR